MFENILQFGLLGFGKMGKIRHQTLNQLERCATEIVYEYEGDITTPVNLKRTTTAEELISSNDIDAVVISVPNYLIKHQACAPFITEAQVKEWQTLAMRWSHSTHIRRSSLLACPCLAIAHDLDKVWYVQKTFILRHVHEVVRNTRSSSAHRAKRPPRE